MILSKYSPDSKIAGVAISNYQFNILNNLNNQELYGKGNFFNLKKDFSNKCINYVTVGKLIKANIIKHTSTEILEGELNNLDIYTITKFGENIINIINAVDKGEIILNSFDPAHKDSQINRLIENIEHTKDSIDKILYSLDNCSGYGSEDVSEDLKSLLKEIINNKNIGVENIQETLNSSGPNKKHQIHSENWLGRGLRPRT